MVQRAKRRFTAVFSIITAFFISFSHKAPEAKAQTSDTTAGSTAPSNAKSIIPSNTKSIVPSSGKSIEPTNAIKLTPSGAAGTTPSNGKAMTPNGAFGIAPSSGKAASPSDAAGTSPASSKFFIQNDPSSGTSPSSALIYTMPASRESDFQNWLTQQGVTQQQLSVEEYRDATMTYRMEKILDRLDQIDKELNSKSQ